MSIITAIVTLTAVFALMWLFLIIFQIRINKQKEEIYKAVSDSLDETNKDLDFLLERLEVVEGLTTQLCKGLEENNIVRFEEHKLN